MKITIRTRNGEIFEYITDQTITTVEMPYMCVGYRFDGSSEASVEDLDKFWNIIDEILATYNLTPEQYQTLISIK